MNIYLDYPVVPLPRHGYGKPPHAKLQQKMDTERSTYKEYLEETMKHIDALATISLDYPQSDKEPFYRNNWLPLLDGVAIYTFLAKHKPARYVEVGSGNSTKFARKAIRDLNLSTKIISIDPQPRAEIDSLCDEVIRQTLETIPIEFFQQLESGDILFIDSSHRSFTNSDVTVAFLEILPIVKPGVIVQVHDIFLPYDYPHEYMQLFYSEQYLLASYLLGGSKLKLLFPNFYVAEDRELFSMLEPLYIKLGVLSTNPICEGCSCWLEVQPD
ncbi:class I SAM-dependent methyltransferase [Brevibacillus laterosporus]|uniref:Class I SAM-dependent methyltransferase n=1 Tax=Brevibacillus laterosporus TaxID=1465 RepID=A0AAP8QEN0_BRELA|nr:class I SAM-dependent methyltransferase [Brevibacillus laterosporus]MCG7315809.1 class I SAM-dependent methyltransferase [Brevibacillus laterosporus]MCR8978331.1 class I SAM-dependent methyltransferase [Brevibacillus laterosporus]MCZ0805487.1 class I SAM-dependent methyltransferase [Brevibacillus laterosporus]MCZ0825809.1 class I SAM-dependent methyltransferase [Brevibacillus laterosporus]MCZ0850093.1 class I SAM-dependent methyltransferase [Brevibacillus laterosporus]